MTSVISETDFFFSLSELFVSTFDAYFQSNCHSKQLKKQLFDQCVANTKNNKKFENWFDIDHPCFSHRKEILDFFLLVLIRKNCIWLLEKLKTEKKQKTSNRRLTILNQ